MILSPPPNTTTTHLKGTKSHVRFINFPLILYCQAQSLFQLSWTELALLSHSPYKLLHRGYQHLQTKLKGPIIHPARAVNQAWNCNISENTARRKLINKRFSSKLTNKWEPCWDFYSYEPYSSRYCVFQGFSWLTGVVYLPRRVYNWPLQLGQMIHQLKNRCCSGL